MICLQKHYKTINLIVFLGMSGAIMLLFAQIPESRRDADQIASLMAALSDRSKVPSDVLDPMLSSDDRAENLKRFSTSRYELSLVPTQPVQVLAEDSASVPIRVHYISDDGARLDANATAHFVRRNGTWYFSNFEFMEWPAFLIIVLVVGVLVAIGYATTVLVLRNRLVKKGQLGGRNLIKVFLPVFWPDLFRQTR
jgi:hypothetical protein